MLAPCAHHRVQFDVPPFRLSGIVYGSLLNQRDALDAMGDAVDKPPYNAAPRAPILYMKPRNTLVVSGDRVTIPAAAEEVEIGACLGVVIGKTACRVSAVHALDHVAGYLIVNDVSLPHRNFYRPSVRFKAQDGFCPLGPVVTPRVAVADPGALSLRTYVDGVLVQTSTTSTLVRPIPQLLADVTEFMTLAPGDVLAAGVAAGAPRARPGQSVTIEIDGLGALSNFFVRAS